MSNLFWLTDALMEQRQPFFSKSHCTVSALDELSVRIGGKIHMGLIVQSEQSKFTQHN